MKRFFQKRSEFLKHGAALIAGGLYIWAIIILLNNDNWIGISALTTMLLAIAAFWSIRENRRIREEDRKLDFWRRSLDEIRSWAQDARQALSVAWLDRDAMTKMREKLEPISARSISAFAEASNLDADLMMRDMTVASNLSNELSERVETAVKHFDQVIGTLNNTANNITNFEIEWGNLKKNF